MSNTAESKKRRLLDLAGCEDYTGIPAKTWQDWVTKERVPFARPAGKGGKAYISTEFLDIVMENATRVRVAHEARVDAEMIERYGPSDEMALETIEERQARQSREMWAEDEPGETEADRLAATRQFNRQRADRQEAAEARARREGWS